MIIGDNMNDRGFTLVELLAVITILALLALTTLEVMDVVNRGNREKTYETQVTSILTSAVSYVSTSKIKLPTVSPNTSGCTTITYNHISDTNTKSEIINADESMLCKVNIYLTLFTNEGVLDSEIKNPKTGKNLDMQASYITITYGKEDDIEDDEVYKVDGHYVYRLHYVEES